MGSARRLLGGLARDLCAQVSPGRFATLAGLQVGIGTVGTLIATAPLAFSTAAIGWRGSFLAVAAFTFVLGLFLAAVLKGAMAGGPHRPHREVPREPVRHSDGHAHAVRRAAVPHEPGQYSSFALIAGLWGGPYLAHISATASRQRGSLLLVPVLAQIVGAMVWGPPIAWLEATSCRCLIGAGLTALLLGYLALVGTLAPVMLVLLVRSFGLPVRLCARC